MKRKVQVVITGEYYLDDSDARFLYNIDIKNKNKKQILNEMFQKDVDDFVLNKEGNNTGILNILFYSKINVFLK